MLMQNAELTESREHTEEHSTDPQYYIVVDALPTMMLARCILVNIHRLEKAVNQHMLQLTRHREIMSHAQSNPEISFKTVGFEKHLMDFVLLLFSCHFLTFDMDFEFQANIWVKNVIFF